MGSVLCRLGGTRIKTTSSKHMGRVKMAIATGIQIMEVQRGSKEICARNVVYLDFQETSDESPYQRLFKKMTENTEKILALYKYLDKKKLRVNS